MVDKQHDLSAVGFEPTRSKTLRPERNPLDHSGKLTSQLHQQRTRSKISLLRPTKRTIVLCTIQHSRLTYSKQITSG